MISTLEKAGAGLLIAAWLIWGANMLGDVLVAPKTAGADKLPFAETKTAAVVPAAAPPTAASAAAPQDFKALLAAAKAEDGVKAFRKCVSCHAAEKGAKHKVGPALWDVVGRPAGKAGGFNYSGAMAKHGQEWTYEALDDFLKSPKTAVPGNKMTFAGLPDAAERAAAIAYLRTLSDQPKPLP